MWMMTLAVCWAMVWVVVDCPDGLLFIAAPPAAERPFAVAASGLAVSNAKTMPPLLAVCQ